MTLCELLTTLKHDKGGNYEVFINRSWELPTYNGEFMNCTIDEWIEGFKDGAVWWSNYDEDGDQQEIYHKWETEMLFSEAELIMEEGPYEEPAGHWINVDY